jgi:AcrR family transcriptional regulator
MDSGHDSRTTNDDRRAAILRAAWGMIRHYGFTKTTIDDIAKRAGVGKGTIYLHFESKADIMLALTELTNDRIATELERIAAGPGSPEERLRECLNHRALTLFDIVHKYPHGEEFIGSMLPEIVVRIARYVRAQGALLAGIIREGNESGDFAVEDPDTTGQLLSELFEFLAPPYYRLKSRRSLEKLSNQSLDLMLAGLRARPRVQAGRTARTNARSPRGAERTRAWETRR